MPKSHDGLDQSNLVNFGQPDFLSLMLRTYCNSFKWKEQTSFWNFYLWPPRILELSIKGAMG